MVYLLNRLRIARYNKIHYKEGNNDKRLSYCKNRGLIYAITLIGRYHVNNPKKSAYKNGIVYLQKRINKDESYRYVSKAEIKAAMRPCNKRKHTLKIPADIERIIENTVEIIHSIPTLHQQCKEMNHVYADFENVQHLQCYHFLIDSLINNMSAIHGAFRDNAPVKDLYNSLSGNHRLCRL